MTILVTGANGFVGSALVRRLARDHRDVLAGLHRTQPGSMPRSVMLGDLAQPQDWRPRLSGVSCIVHAAARVHVLDERASDPLAAFRAVNVAGTLALARQAAEAGVRRFVFVSSIKVNGESTPPGVPFKADDKPGPLDAYGVSKHEAEQALSALAQTTGMEVVIVRPPLVYGPGVRANFRALMRLLTLRVPLPFGAINNARSLVGIGNLADFLVHCIDSPAAAHRTFLVSDGEDVSTTDLLRRLGMALQRRPLLVPFPQAALMALGSLAGQGERVRRLCENLQVDLDSTRQTLGWKPPQTLDMGLAETARHFLHEARN